MHSVEQLLGHILEQAVVEGYLTSTAASEGPAHRAGFLGFEELVFQGQVPQGQVAQEQALSGQWPLDDAVAVDLGTGGGVPGLVLAATTPWQWVLVDRGERRAIFLRWAVRQLGLEDRVEVRCVDAVDVGRGALRGRASLVTARGFAPPGPTAECAAPLLAEGGVLVVSEPPIATGHRWPDAGLGLLGLADAGSWVAGEVSGTASYQAMVRVESCPDRFPRRFARQTADPLF